MLVDRTPAPHAPYLLAAIVGLGLLLGLLRLWSDPPSIADDQTETWWPVVLSVADGHGYVECLPMYFPFCGPGNDATAMREPAPIYLFAAVAAIHRSLWLAGIVQLVLHLLIILAIHRMVRELAGARAALIAAGIWAVYMPALLVLPQIAGDQVATLTMTLGLWCYLRAWRTGHIGQWILAGACMGLAVLSRSALLATIVPLTLALAWHMRSSSGTVGGRSKPLFAFILSWSMIMLPWLVRNQMVFHQPVVGSTLTGYNILRHNHQLPSDDPYRYINEVEARPVAYAALARHRELTGRENEAQVDRVYRTEGMAIIKANKAHYAVLCAYRFLPLWFNWKVYAAYGKETGVLDLLMLVQQALLLVLALLGLRYAPRRAWPLVFCVLVLSMAYMAIVARLRYVIPVMPVVILLAAIALDRWLPQRLRARRKLDSDPGQQRSFHLLS